MIAPFSIIPCPLLIMCLSGPLIMLCEHNVLSLFVKLNNVGDLQANAFTHIHTLSTPVHPIVHPHMHSRSFSYA